LNIKRFLGFLWYFIEFVFWAFVVVIILDSLFIFLIGPYSAEQKAYEYIAWANSFQWPFREIWLFGISAGLLVVYFFNIFVAYKTAKWLAGEPKWLKKRKR